jgi:NADH-quinone oxidoreductase subunit E/NADP-reducing hydrogenase subunit HndA
MSSVKVELKQEQINTIHSICDSFGNQEGELINILHKAQETFGYLPAEIQEVIAEKLEIAAARVYGVVTFYSFFTMIPRGEFPVSICTGTACYVRGAQKVLDEFKKELNIAVGETTGDGKFSLSCLRCVGACGLAPVVLVGEKTFGRVAPDDVKSIIEQFLEPSANKIL